MRVINITHKRDLNFLKSLLADSPSKREQTKSPAAWAKEAAEIAVIFLLYAVLFVGASFWTIKLLELFILLLKQFFSVPQIFETAD